MTRCPAPFAATPAHDRLKLPALADAVSLSNPSGFYSVITKKQTAMFNDLFYLVTGILRPLIGQLITQGVNRQNQAGEIITLHERPAVLVVAGRG